MRPVGLGVLVGALVLVALSGLPTAIADVPSDDGRVLQAAGCHEGVEATEARECLVVAVNARVLWSCCSGTHTQLS